MKKIDTNNDDINIIDTNVSDSISSLSVPSILEANLVNNRYNAFDDTNVFYNMFKISKYIKTIKRDFILKNKEPQNSRIELVIQLWKKISKTNFIAKVMFKQIDSSSKTISKNFVIINFNSSMLNEQTAKQERKSFASNIIEEVLSLIEDLKINIIGINVIADAYFLINNYLVSVLKKLNLKNLDINLRNSSFNYNQYKDLIKEIEKIGDDNIDSLIKKNKLILGVQVENEKQLTDILVSIPQYSKIKNDLILNENNLSLELIIYIIKEIDINVVLDNIAKENKKISTDTTNNTNSNTNKILSSFQNLEFKLTIINVNSLSNEFSMFCKDDNIKLASELFYLHVPDYIELNLSEIYSPLVKEDNINNMNNNNNRVSLFKQVILKLNSKFFAFTNSYKLFLRKSIKNNFTLISKIREKLIIKDIMRKYIGFSNEVFNYNDKYLQMNINLSAMTKAPEKIPRYISNLIADFNSISTRKIGYEQLYKLLLPNKQNEQKLKSHFIPLHKYDINSASKLLQKISGNSLLFASDGKVISIGGYFKHIFDSKQVLLPFNAVIIFTETLNKITVFSFRDDFFMTQMFSSAMIVNKEFLDINKIEFAEDDFPEPLDKNNNSIGKEMMTNINEFIRKDNSYALLISGGTSNSELIGNFVDTPVYLMMFYHGFAVAVVKRLDDYYGSSITNSRKLLFKHYMKIDCEMKYILLYSGMSSSSVTKGFNIFNNKDKENSDSSNSTDTSKLVSEFNKLQVSTTNKDSNDIGNSLVNHNIDQYIFEVATKKWYKVDSLNKILENN